MSITTTIRLFIGLQTVDSSTPQYHYDTEMENVQKLHFSRIPSYEFEGLSPFRLASRTPLSGVRSPSSVSFAPETPYRHHVPMREPKKRVRANIPSNFSDPNYFMTMSASPIFQDTMMIPRESSQSELSGYAPDTSSVNSSLENLELSIDLQLLEKVPDRTTPRLNRHYDPDLF